MCAHPGRPAAPTDCSSLPVLPPHRKYAEALDYHRQALVLIPQNASTYSAIGYIHSLMGNFENAVDYFHTVRLLFVPRTLSLVESYHLFETSFLGNIFLLERSAV